jgi:hypothetical protein
VNGHEANPIFTPDNVSIYPNPNGGKFTIEMSKTEGAKVIALIDMSGKVISKSIVDGGIANYEVNNVAAGTYNVVITGDGASITKRVVIIK